MRLNDASLSFVINFLLGVAWAIAFLGASSTFFSFYQESLSFALIYSVIAFLPGLIAVLLLEHILTSRATYFELTKQSKLLEALLKKD